jgi:hypothetical protein
VHSRPTFRMQQKAHDGLDSLRLSLLHGRPSLSRQAWCVGSRSLAAVLQLGRASYCHRFAGILGPLGHKGHHVCWQKSHNGEQAPAEGLEVSAAAMRSQAKQQLAEM